ncbi:MAG: pilus assembly protein [Candidatus Eremiobacteraeota bacterium]|jgi:tight adherence protein B|nr:pilus assembly protein [Candidatus Eremiobacteraeota bacterium]
MGNSLIPLGIVLGGIVSVALIFVAAWQPLSRNLALVGGRFSRELDVSGITMRPETLGSVVLAFAVAAWAILIAFTRPGVVGGALQLVIVCGFSLGATKAYLSMRVARTVRKFGDQFENVLRMFAGAVRVGLGLRQALIHVADQSSDPARRELTRVVGATNLGLSLVDALDGLSTRMTLQETQVFARLVRVQAQTGSDLAGVLDGLADTIRDRRRFLRKVAAITSQGRATAWLLGMLPLAIGAFVLTTQPMYRAISLGTAFGRGGLVLALVLDGLAVFVLLRLTRVDA